MAGKKIVLVGEPMGLFIAREYGGLSEVENFSCAVAGAEYNVAVGLSRLGHEVSYCTRLGMDPFGDRIVKAMQDNGIGTDYVIRTDSSLTGFMMKNKVSKGDPEIYYYRKNSAASTISCEEITSLNLDNCGFFHMTGIFPAVSDYAMKAVKALLARAKEKGLVISFDPNIRPQLWKSCEQMISTMNLLAEDADIILPGISEGEILTGKSSPEGIAQFYHNLGVKMVVIKRGDRETYYSEKNKGDGYAQGIKVQRIVDTVGAGDGFAAGLISALAEGLALKEAVIRANAVGAIQLTSKSDNEGLPDRDKLEEVIKRGTV